MASLQMIQSDKSALLPDHLNILQPFAHDHLLAQCHFDGQNKNIMQAINPATVLYSAVNLAIE